MEETALKTKPEEGRRGDGLLRVAQDNQSRALIIEDINEAALAKLGFKHEELKGRKIEVILAHASALVIDEELEYAEDAPDFADIFSHYRELRLRLYDGQEINAPFRINRLLATNQQHFQLILPNDRDDRARQNLRDFLKTNLEGHQQLDTITGLPDRNTMGATIERIHNFSSEETAQVCVAVIRLDRFEKAIAQYGLTPSQDLLRHVASICRSTFRSEDVIASLGKHIGLVLIDISRESARVVLNRLRWNISSHLIAFGGKANFSVTISLTFDMLKAENAMQILRSCEQSITDLDVDARNAFLELGQ